jgi:hypothetical protein
MTNLGKGDEEDAAFEISSEGLGISVKRTDITLVEDPFDEDNDYVLNVPFTVSQDAAAGNYSIDFKAWFRNQIVMDKRTAYLLVEQCPTSQPVQQPTEEGEEQVQPQPTTPPTESGGQPTAGEQPAQQPEQITSSVEKPLTSSPAFIAGMVFLNIAVIAVLIFAGAKLIAKKQPTSQEPAEQGAEDEDDEDMDK